MRDLKGTINELQPLVHPTRFEICRELKQRGGYTSQIAKKLNIDPKLAAFHLTSLARNGLVTAHIVIKDPPEKGSIAVRNYRLTEKAIKLMEKLDNVLG